MSLIKQDLINADKYKIKCPYEMKPIGIVIHNTFNDAPAKNEVAYMKSNNNKVSFHVGVDDVEAIQVIPFNRNAWANGDGGSGEGNRKYISVEICYSKSGGERFVKAEKLASKVVAEICKSYGFGINNIKAHRDFAKKDCPHRTNMNDFKKMIEAELNVKTVQASLRTLNNGEHKGNKAKVIANSLNIRFDRGTNFNVIGKLKKGDIVNLDYCLNDWIAIEGFKGNKGFGYVSTEFLELL